MHSLQTRSREERDNLRFVHGETEKREENKMKVTFRDVRLEHFDPASPYAVAEVYLFLQDAMCHLCMEDDTFDILYEAKCKVAKELKEVL